MELLESALCPAVCAELLIGYGRWGSSGRRFKSCRPDQKPLGLYRSHGLQTIPVTWFTHCPVLV